MDKNNCSCRKKFMDAEDFRDHLPCPGSEIEKLKQEIEILKIENQKLEKRALTDDELKILYEYANYNAWEGSKILRAIQEKKMYWVKYFPNSSEAKGYCVYVPHMAFHRIQNSIGSRKFKEIGVVFAVYCNDENDANNLKNQIKEMTHHPIYAGPYYSLQHNQ